MCLAADYCREPLEGYDPFLPVCTIDYDMVGGSDCHPPLHCCTRKRNDEIANGAALFQFSYSGRERRWSVPRYSYPLSRCGLDDPQDYWTTKIDINIGVSLQHEQVVAGVLDEPTESPFARPDFDEVAAVHRVVGYVR